MNQEYKIYKITYFLMAVNVIAYLYTSLKYGLSMSAMQGIQVGGFNPLYVYYYHEYYRLITANFIHFGLMHIFCNVYSLYNLGMLMEKILKEKKENLLREKADILAQTEIIKQSTMLVNTSELIDLKQSESNYISSIDNLVAIIDKLLEGGESNG